ncbi:MAG TPA: hypothetical protein VGB82_04950 [Alphaproteobacteria bacterium]
MKKIEAYLKHAADCDGRARKAGPEQRDMIMQMAKTSRMLAEQRRKKLAKQNPPDGA